MGNDTSDTTVDVPSADNRSSADSEEVWLGPSHGHGRVYHTTLDCRYADSGMPTVTLDVANEWARICQTCEGDS